MQNVFDDDTVLNTLNSFTPKAPDLEDAIDEYFEDHKDVTAPSELDWDLRPECVSDIRKAIEAKISKKWEVFESSRTISIDNVKKGDASLVEVKKAIIPYVKKGWFVTMSLPCHKDKNRMNTYEADISFITTNNYGKKDQSENIFLRMYPKIPIKKKYISRVIRPDLFFGTPMTLFSIAVSILLIKMFSLWFIFAAVALGVASLLFVTIMAGERMHMRKKQGHSKKYGPLLWRDNIEGYKTEHKMISRLDRVKEVVDNRVLSLAE